jgi:twitching motility protein PilT
MSTISTRAQLDGILRQALMHGASDIHLKVGSVPAMRINGDMVGMEMPILTREYAQSLLFPLLHGRLISIFNETGNADFSYEIQGVSRFRVNYLQQYYGMGAVFRVIPEELPTVEKLGIPDVIKKIALFRRGLVVMTGATGSGKSTTLAAMLNHINDCKRAHIITIEDPIEFVHPSRMCLIDQREVGRHTHSFADALRSAIRESPDIILVGELRDLETISLAIKAAETGVLVLGTLHTNSAAKAVDRMIDVFPSREQEQVRAMISLSVKAIIAQQLLKTADGKGRVAALEILISTPALGNLIREGKVSHISSIIQTGRSEGMQSMDHALIDLVRAGKITPELALARAHQEEMVKRNL